MLDTNICIHLIQRQPAQVLSRFKALKRGDVVMPFDTDAAVRYGEFVENWMTGVAP